MKIQNKNLAFSILQKNPKSLHVTSGSDNNMDLITTQYWHKREGSWCIHESANDHNENEANLSDEVEN